ncbi:MAG: RidA family protein [Alphaproteobacteria bacterium]
MSGQIAARLQELGIELPEPPKPVASYVPYVITGDLIFVSGQVPMDANGIQYRGIVGYDFSVEEAQDAARLCALNIVAQLSDALDGNLDRVTRVVRLGGFVRCTGDFTDQPKVINGASDLMVEIFGDTGRHARAAVGVNALPVGVAVEVDAVVAFE